MLLTILYHRFKHVLKQDRMRERIDVVDYVKAIANMYEDLNNAELSKF